MPRSEAELGQPGLQLPSICQTGPHSPVIVERSDRWLQPQVRTQFRQCGIGILVDSRDNSLRVGPPLRRRRGTGPPGRDLAILTAPLFQPSDLRLADLILQRHRLGIHPGVTVSQDTLAHLNRINVRPTERTKLIKLGVPLASAIKDLITIVHPRTFARWLSKSMNKAKPRKRGRPRKPERIRALILQMATGTGWRYRQILGELRKLRVKVSRSTVARILRENGFDPGPKRGEGTWREFVQRHIKTLWATDLFTKKNWTLRGSVTYYILFFIHIQTRRVHIAGMTASPDAAWMAQQARNMRRVFDEVPEEYRPTHIIRDRDSKFTEQFCAIVESDGIEFK